MKRSGNHEEEGRLAGPGQARAHMRAWYFSHQEYDDLRKHHEHRAQELRKQAQKLRDRASKGHAARRRNKARLKEYAADMRDYERRRLEKEEALAEWRELRAEILGRHGGIKGSSIGPDYDVPASLRSSNPRAPALDDMAGYFGYGHEDDFLKYVNSTRRRATEARARAIKRPSRPTLEKEPGIWSTAFARTAKPELRAMRAEIDETRALIHEGSAELGSRHPAVDALRADLRELRREYAEAARAA